MPMNTLKQAAERHEAAGKSQRMSAEHHEKGDHARGEEQSEMACGHSDAAQRTSAEAHGKSASGAQSNA